MAQELRADLALIDDLKARKVAEAEGLKVRGSIGTLEAAFRKGHLSDLRQAFRHLVEAGLYLDRRILESILKEFDLPSLQL